ncbi:MAG: hypothetical protein LDL33_06920 [Desulfomonile sp.]|nr:hypothetical protein [Desulfomonile sp.]
MSPRFFISLFRSAILSRISASLSNFTGSPEPAVFEVAYWRYSRRSSANSFFMAAHDLAANEEVAEAEIRAVHRIRNALFMDRTSLDYRVEMSGQGGSYNNIPVGATRRRLEVHLLDEIRFVICRE